MVAVSLLFVSIITSALNVAALEGGCPRGCTLLQGWLGVGKTFFCNKYDGTVCPQCDNHELQGACTAESYKGNSFIDGPGLGHNTAILSSSGLDGSLWAIYETLRACNSTDIRAVAWVVPCTTHRTQVEAFDLMKLIKDMLGAPIPFVAIFNPADPRNSCVTTDADFMNQAATHGLRIDDVIHIDDFDLIKFEERFAKTFRVILPPELERMLEKQDPKYLAAQIKKARDARCDELPGHLQALRTEMNSVSASIVVPEASVGDCAQQPCTTKTCTPRHCTAPKVTIDDCSREVCISYDNVCSGWGPFKDCGLQCSSRKSYEDPGCITRNDHRASTAKQELDACLSQSEINHATCTNSAKDEFDACQVAQHSEYSQCQFDRNATIAQLENKNTDFRKQLELLRQDESMSLSNLNTCDATLMGTTE